MGVLVVPVKRLERAKTRLAPVLDPSERAALTLAMLEDVLGACLAQEGWETRVVSGSRPALDLAARAGARPVGEEGRSLREAVRQAEREAPPGEALAVLLADLPLLRPEELASALAAAQEAPVTVAPSPDGGTNLLVRRPPAVIPARFGPRSCSRHLWAARKARVAVREVHLPGLAFDLDRPEDLVPVLSSDYPTRTRSACLAMGVEARLRARA